MRMLAVRCRYRQCNICSPYLRRMSQSSWLLHLPWMTQSSHVQAFQRISIIPTRQNSQNPALLNNAETGSSYQSDKGLRLDMQTSTFERHVLERCWDRNLEEGFALKIPQIPKRSAALCKKNSTYIACTHALIDKLYMYECTSTCTYTVYMYMCICRITCVYTHIHTSTYIYMYMYT